MSMGPSLIWQNFQGIWTADMRDLVAMREHLEKQIAAASDYWTRIGPEMALGTINREIALRERTNANVANPT